MDQEQKDLQFEETRQHLIDTKEAIGKLNESLIELPQKLAEKLFKDWNVSLSELVTLDEESKKIEVVNLKDLSESLDAFRQHLTETVKELLDREIKVANPDEILGRKEIIVSNIDGLTEKVTKLNELLTKNAEKEPQKIVIKAPDVIVKQNEIKLPTANEKKKAIPVVLVDKTLSRLYDALAILTTETSQGLIAFRDSNNKPVQVSDAKPLPVDVQNAVITIEGDVIVDAVTIEHSEFERIKNQIFADTEEVRYDIPNSVSKNNAGTYSQTGTTITVTNAAHGLLVGQAVDLDFTTGAGVDGQYIVATVPTANTFTVTATAPATTSGAVTVRTGTIYTGIAPDGTAESSAVWKIVRTYFDTNGKPTRERIRTNVAWDSRNVGW